MRIVFTGTRKGMTLGQLDQLRLVLRALGGRGGQQEFHHGGAVGADLQAASIAEQYGWSVHGHPAGDDPLARNREMVDLITPGASGQLSFVVAAPDGDAEKQRSGTWATVRYARKASLPVIMLARGQ